MSLNLRSNSSFPKFRAHLPNGTFRPGETDLTLSPSSLVVIDVVQKRRMLREFLR